MNYTPGKWEVSELDDTLVVHRGGSAIVAIADCVPYDPMNAYGRVTEKEGLANAKLISAAPELAAENTRLKELNREMVGMLKDVLYYELPSDVYETIREMIAKT